MFGEIILMLLSKWRYVYLIAENLLLRNLLEPGNIRDDDGNDEVDHDNGAEHDEPHQQHHGEHLGHARAGEL